MLCEKCQLRQSTIHLTEIIKDVKSELHLCEHCAREVGLNSKLSNFTLSVPEMLSFLEVNELEKENNLMACPHCGLTYADFRKSNMVGCAECYNAFNVTIESMLLNYHSEKMHVGKIPNGGVYSNEKVEVASKNVVAVHTVDELKEQLDHAILEERFEEAAVLRDRIKEFK